MDHHGGFGKTSTRLNVISIALILQEFDYFQIKIQVKNHQDFIKEYIRLENQKVASVEGIRS